MIAGIAFGVIVFLVAAAMLSRQASRNKKRAIADLERERDEVGTFSIMDLVESEVDALGLADIEGSGDIPHAVLLKTWSDNKDVVESCSDRSYLRFVVAPGVDPKDANHDDITLECTRTTIGTPDATPQRTEDETRDPDSGTEPSVKT